MVASRHVLRPMWLALRTRTIATPRSIRWLALFAFAAACGGSSARPDAPAPDVIACPARFSPAATFAVAAGSAPRALASGDFNADSVIDLAVVDSGAANVSILLGGASGTNTFPTVTPYPVDTDPQAIVVHDFDGDGHLDLAIADEGGNDIALLHGDANGAFEPPDEAPVAAGPRAIVLGDFNGDGHLDLATAGAGSISVLIGGVGSTFGAHLDTVVDTAPLAGLAAGDFDHDGKVDLVTGLTSNGAVAVLLGKGDGTFAAPVTYPTGTGPVTDLASADLDQDSYLDVVAASDATPAGVVTLPGLAGGKLGAPSAPVVTRDPAIAVVVGDFDGDGLLDIAYATASAVAVAYAKTPGAFAAPTALTTNAAPAGLALGDFDQNGQLDLATPNAADSVSVFLEFGCGP